MPRGVLPAKDVARVPNKPVSDDVDWPECRNGAQLLDAI